jgi:uncharacterized delta-60 repeat protein
MAVQADGKVVVAGEATGGFGMLARLDPDGHLDPSFGDGGIVIDRRSPPFLDGLAIQPDGKVVVLDAWENLRRYRADGSPDLGFGRGGIAARPADWPDETPVLLRSLSDGRIVVVGNRGVKMIVHQVPAYVVSGDGRSVEAAGEVGDSRGPWAWLSAIGLDDDGSLLVAGSAIKFEPENVAGSATSFLARFVPGAGSPYDSDFGGGAGLVAVPRSGSSLPVLKALAPMSGGLYAAGTVGWNAGGILLARFSEEGALDGGFASGGFAQVSPGPAFSQGNDLAVQPDGKVVVAGETVSKEGRTGRACHGCRSPLLVRFLPDGTLDPAFGHGGVARVTSADRRYARAMGETVAVLPDGRALIAGTATSSRPRVLVSRVRQDGQVDRSFGSAGIATVDACPGKPAAQRRNHCLPSVRAKLRVRRGRQRRISLSLRVRANLDWASVTKVTMRLPRQLQVNENRGWRIKATAVERDGTWLWGRTAVARRHLTGGWSGSPKAVTLTVPAGVLRRVKEVPAGQKLPFRIKVWFAAPYFGYGTGGAQAIVLRRALG